MSGRRSNSASITGPITCTTRPTLRATAAARGATVAVSGAVAAISVSFACSVKLFERRGAADDLGDLLRDRGLPHPVVGAREALQHVAGVVGGVLHRRAAGALLGGRGLHQRAVDAVAHVEREHLPQDLVGPGLQ